MKNYSIPFLLLLFISISVNSQIKKHNNKLNNYFSKFERAQKTNKTINNLSIKSNVKNYFTADLDILTSAKHNDNMFILKEVKINNSNKNNYTLKQVSCNAKIINYGTKVGIAILNKSIKLSNCLR